MIRLVLLTPNADPTLDLDRELAAYTQALREEGLEVLLGHAVLEAGPVRIETEADALAAAPMVVRTVRALARDGIDAIVLDCMSEPGLAAAQAAVAIPIVGPRSAVLAHAGDEPVAFVGDEAEALSAVAAGVRLLAADSTGAGALAAQLAHLDALVLDPLLLAFRAAVDSVRRSPPGRSTCP